MIFSLKEKLKQVEINLQKEWVDEVVNFVKLIVLGIDAKFIAKQGEGYFNTIQIGLPTENDEKPFNVVAGIVFHDEGNNSVLLDISWDSLDKGKFIIPSQKEDFAKELKKTLNRIHKKE